MTTRSTLLLGLVTPLLLVSCSPGSSPGSESSATKSKAQTTVLTTQRAQAAVDVAFAHFKQAIQQKFNVQFLSTNPRAVVQGVREDPSQNLAEADIVFVNAQYKMPGPGVVSYDGQLPPGQAEFKKYTDGRWVLTKFGTGFISSFGDMTTNIEVR